MPGGRKIKLDFLTKEEISPHLIDLRQKEKKVKQINITSSARNFRRASIFISILFLVIVGILFAYQTYNQIQKLKIEIVNESDSQITIFFEAFEHLERLEFIEAQNKFILIEKNFEITLKKIESSNPLINWLANFYPAAKTNFNILRALKDASRVGFLLAQTGQETTSLIKINGSQLSTESILPAEILEFNFLEKTSFLKSRATEIYYLLEKINQRFDNIQAFYLPNNFQQVFNLLKKESNKVKNLAQNAVEFLSVAEKIFGQGGLKRYLIVFQNNNEMRPSGGFLGTYAQVDFDYGKIVYFEMPPGGTYDLAGQLSVRVAPPKPLFIAHPKWQFHDANWFPDWPTSAQKLAWFYERSGGVTVDGVIAINAEFLPDILEIIGEVESEDYQRILDKDNFILEIQKIIGIDRKEENEPKQVLVELTPIIFSKILNLEPTQLLNLFSKINQGLERKKASFYFNDQKINQFFIEKKLAGEIKESSFDYLMINSANVNGAKAEGKILEKVFYKLEVDKDGSMIATLNIKRNHRGQINEPFYGKKDLSWVRAYLPAGSIFLGAKSQLKRNLPISDLPIDNDLKNIEKEISIDNFSGTRVTQEFGKTCLGNFIEIEPGQENDIFFKYLLPFKIDLNSKGASYNLMIQKQSGRSIDLSVEIILPEKRKIVWTYPTKEIEQENNIIKFSSLIDRDKIFAFVLE